MVYFLPCKHSSSVGSREIWWVMIHKCFHFHNYTFTALAPELQLGLNIMKKSTRPAAIFQDQEISTVIRLLEIDLIMIDLRTGGIPRLGMGSPWRMIVAPTDYSILNQHTTSKDPPSAASNLLIQLWPIYQICPWHQAASAPHCRVQEDPCGLLEEVAHKSRMQDNAFICILPTGNPAPTSEFRVQSSFLMPPPRSSDDLRLR